MPEKRTLRFEGVVPRSYRRHVAREVKRLHLTDWTIVVSVLPQEELAGGAYADDSINIGGMTQSDPVYKIGIIQLADDLIEGEQMVHIIRHELLHLKYSAIEQSISNALTLPTRLRRKEVFTLLRDAIEQAIEWDCNILRDLC